MNAFDPFAKRGGIDLLFGYDYGSELIKLGVVDGTVEGREHNDFYSKSICPQPSHDVDTGHDSPIGDDEIKMDRAAFKQHYGLIDVFGENGVMSGQWENDAQGSPGSLLAFNNQDIQVGGAD